MWSNNIASNEKPQKVINLWEMSFRSRSRTVQPVVQRRSLSGSRVPSTVSSYSNSRPLSLAYPSSYSAQNYTSPYTSASRDSIYNSSPLSRSNSYYNGGSSGANSCRRDTYGSTIYKNPYASERYVSPYTSYDNGITTAGLSLKSSYGGTHGGYGCKSSYTSAYANKPSNRHSSSLVSASNSSLNSYTSSLPSTSSMSNLNSSISRSQSLKDPEQDRKSRSVRRHSSLKSTRSLSVSSEKSEGYEVSKFVCQGQLRNSDFFSSPSLA